MAKELWIGVDADGTTLVYNREPCRYDGEWQSEVGGNAVCVDELVSLSLGIPPGHKAKLVLDEASVTKGGE